MFYRMLFTSSDAGEKSIILLKNQMHKQCICFCIAKRTPESTKQKGIHYFESCTDVCIQLNIHLIRFEFTEMHFHNHNNDRKACEFEFACV